MVNKQKTNKKKQKNKKQKNLFRQSDYSTTLQNISDAVI